MVRNLEIAAGALGFLATGCFAAAWWTPPFAWSGVALAVAGLGALLADTWFQSRAGIRSVALETKVANLEQQVEALNRRQALNSIR